MYDLHLLLYFYTWPHYVSGAWRLLLLSYYVADFHFNQSQISTRNLSDSQNMQNIWNNNRKHLNSILYIVCRNVRLQINCEKCF